MDLINLLTFHSACNELTKSLIYAWCLYGNFFPRKKILMNFIKCEWITFTTRKSFRMSWNVLKWAKMYYKLNTCLSEAVGSATNFLQLSEASSQQQNMCTVKFIVSSIKRRIYSNIESNNFTYETLKISPTKRCKFVINVFIRFSRIFIARKKSFTPTMKPSTI